MVAGAVNYSSLQKLFLTVSIYQMPNPMSVMPIASHPNTPIAMIVSSVIRDSRQWCLDTVARECIGMTEALSRKMDAQGAQMCRQVPCP